MPETPTFIQLLAHLLEDRYGGWIQPNEMHPCRGSLEGCPIIWTAPYELRKLTVSWLRQDDTGVPQDAAQITMHFLNLTDGDPDETWTTGDYETVESGFDTFWEAVDGYYAVQTVLSEYSWRADGPAFKPHGSTAAPVLRAVARSLPGSTENQPLPPQVAVTVTEVTEAKFTVEDVEGWGDQLRNRWGRFYMPPPDTLTSSAGRLTSVFAQDLSEAVGTFYNGLVAGDLIPVMYSPTTGNAWSITEVHVDDIFDVIRSRRYVTPASRHVTGISAP